MLITERALLNSSVALKLLQRHITLVSSLVTLTAKRSLYQMFQVPCYRANMVQRIRLKTNEAMSTLLSINHRIIDMHPWISFQRRACHLFTMSVLKSQHLVKNEILSTAASMAVVILFQLRKLI